MVEKKENIQENLEKQKREETLKMFKARAYDLLAAQQRIQAELNEINKRIMEISNHDFNKTYPVVPVKK